MPKPFFSQSHNKIIQEIIRVNHAGEFGAQKIYQGQIRYTRNLKNQQVLKHMLEQEQEHLDYFTDNAWLLLSISALQNTNVDSVVDWLIKQAH